MRKLTLIALVSLISLFQTYGQNPTWGKAVEKWEASKDMQPQYCVKKAATGAKGYASDYNTGGYIVEGDMIYEKDSFKINVKKIVNKGEVIETDGNPTKDSYADLLHVKENLIFASGNQQYVTYEEESSENDIVVYKYEANIPTYDKFSGLAKVKTDGTIVEVVSTTSAANKSGASNSEIKITYSELNGKLVVSEYSLNAKIEFFGAATYQSTLYLFSKY